MRLFELKNPSPDKVVKDIKTKCSQWLGETQGLPVFRGLGSRADPYYRLKVPKDRKPLHSDPARHEKLNLAFEMAGLDINRSNSAFISGNRSEAYKYSKYMGIGMKRNVYLVFFFDGYNYAWSPDIRDMFMGVGALLNNVRYHKDFDSDVYTVYDAIPKEKIVPGLIETLAAGIKDKYQTTNLEEAIKSQNEIMVAGSYYYAVHEDYFKEHNLGKHLGIKTD